MGWFRVEDALPDGPKFEKLEREFPKLYEKAITLWLFAGLFCSRNGTDGRVSEYKMERLVPTLKRYKPVADALISCGLFEYDGDYLVHDYLDYNPSKAEKDKERRLSAERQRRWKEKNRNALLTTVTNATENGVSNGVTNGRVTGGVTEALPNHSKPFQTIPIDSGQLAKLINAAHKAEGLGPYNQKTNDYQKLQDALPDLHSLSAEHRRPPEEIAKQSLKCFYTDKEKWLKDGGYPIGSWTQRVSHYYQRGEPPKPCKQPPNPEEQWRNAKAAEKAANEKQ